LPRIVLIRSLLFVLPFVVWFVWAAWARRTGRPMGSTPWPWLLCAGAVLMGLSLILSVVLHRDNRHDVYVPGEVTASGAVTPGRFVERPAAHK
jgi:hypothetical protein